MKRAMLRSSFFEGKNLLWALVASSTIHGLLMVIGLVIQSRPPPKNSRPVELEIREFGTLGGGFESKPAEAKRPKSQTAKNRVSFGLRDFSPKMELNRNLGLTLSQEKAHRTDDQNWPPSQKAAQWAVQTSLGESIALDPFIQLIWQRIDNHLDYPEDFAKQRIQGSVTIQFEVTPEGVFTGQVFHIDATDLTLKAYIIVTLLDGLNLPMPQLAEPPKEAIPISAHFEFRVYSTPGQPGEKKEMPFKNHLSFKRLIFVEPKLNEDIEYYLTRYVPPIIPIPGGVYIDFVHAYKMIADWDKPDPREMRKLRVSMYSHNLKRKAKTIVR